ncbi:MAG: protein kinase [Gemmatimonadetes bacterium]|nr:protein kinase [Gemmatimonadota bacterium]
MQCAHCATPVPDTAKYCQNCGSFVSDAEGQAAATAAMDASAFAQMEQMLREDTKGEFEILRLLGRGGMAMVYLGTEIHLARKVAIKVLPPELTFGHGVERFKREAKTAAALDHPNIIPIYRVAAEGKIFWYAMKYLEGRSLEDLLKEQPRLPLKQTIEILAQVADALDYAHEHKVIHRDIKPANVMLDARGRVVVTDFGIAKALTEGTLTASGSVIGTPYFMSPEQGMGKTITGASDQYSVGVMAYRMLSGQIPFEGDSAIEILHKHCTAPPPPLEVISAGLPRHVSWAVHRTLDKRPEQRFPTVTAFVEALRHPTPEFLAAAAATGAATVVFPEGPRPAEPARLTPTKPTPPSAAKGKPRVVAGPKKKGWKPVVVVLGVLAAAGGAGATWLLTTGSPEGQGSGPSAPPPPVEQARVPAAPVSQLPSQPSGPSAPAEAERRPADVAAPVPPAPGRIIVTGLPVGGTVTADGRRQQGLSFEVAAGRHELRLEASGYESVVRTVMVTASRELRVPFAGRALPPAAPRQGQVAQAPTAPQPSPTQPAAPPPADPAAGLSVLRLSITPAANVLLDGVDRGQKSRLQETMVPGTHTLRFVREGFVTKDTTITLAAGETVLLRIELAERRR